MTGKHGWQPIDTFPKPEPKDGVLSTDSERVLLYFPDIRPHEVIGYCRATAAYGGVYWEWCDDNGDQVENGSGRIEPSHWAPMLAAPEKAS